MKSNTSKERVCSDSSRQLYNLIASAQKNRFDLKEIGVFHLVDEIDRLRQLWKEAEDSKRRLNDELTNSERLLMEARKKLEIFDIDIKDTRQHMRVLMDENKALKLDLNVFETREKQLKDVMKTGVFDSMTKEERDQFAFLREPLTRTYSKRVQERHRHLLEETIDNDDDSEVDYDVTGDSIDEPLQLRNGRDIRRSAAAGSKKRSTSAHVAPAPQPAYNSKRSRSRVMTATIEEEPNFQADGSTPPKRCRDGSVHHEVTTTTTTTTTTVRGDQPPRTSIHRQATRRSMSVGSVPSYETPGHTTGINGGMSSAIMTKSTLDMRTMKRGVTAWTSGTPGDIALRQHSFEDGGVNLKVSKCDKCNSGLFGHRTVKCKDCHQVVHKQCACKLHVPCIPRQKPMATPKSASKTMKRDYRIQDFCTTSKPMIPYPIIHCVVALEKRELIQEGLYRVPGSTRRVTDVLDALRKERTVPNLDVQDVEVITETLKRFLRELRDPLVPRTSREEFISAAHQISTNPDQGRLSLNRVICELPQANRDTMAYLFIHWRKVISMSDKNKMPKENMARVLAPCVMGLTNSRTFDQASASQDITNCERTLNALFTFDDGYWLRFLGTGLPIETPRHESVAICDRSMLGPVTHSPGTPLLSRAPARRQLKLLGHMD